MNISPAYISKHNSNHEKKIILLMISNGEGWHYLAVKKLYALLREITLKHDGYFHCLNCLENKDFCDVVMPSEDTKILEFTQYQKSDKTPFIIHADLKSLIKNRWR